MVAQALFGDFPNDEFVPVKGRGSALKSLSLLLIR